MAHVAVEGAQGLGWVVGLKETPTVLPDQRPREVVGQGLADAQEGIPRPTTSVGDGPGLVEVVVNRNPPPAPCKIHPGGHGVHIGPVHIDQAPGGVDEPEDISWPALPRRPRMVLGLVIMRAAEAIPVSSPGPWPGNIAGLEMRPGRSWPWGSMPKRWIQSPPCTRRGRVRAVGTIGG